MIVGTIGYDVHSGLGHLCRDFIRHGVVQRILVIPHPRYQRHKDWYPNGVGFNHFKGPNGIEGFLNGLTHLLLFENAWWWHVASKAKKRGVKIALMPMYEWTPNPLPVRPDVVVCPSDLDLQYFPGHRCERLNVPVEMPWRLRELARVFVHNAGHGQVGFAKGTPEVLAAMPFVKSPIKLIVRGQDDEARTRDLRSLVREHDPRVDVRVGQFSAEDLYGEGDVFLNAERYNGLSLPLQEAFASGMAVMTTNRFPANAWLPRGPLIPVESWDQHRVNQTTFDRARVDPRMIASRVDLMYEQDISELSRQGKAWAEANSWEVLGPQYVRLLEGL